MNKGLELIEAHHLFGTPYADIDVIVHPQSIIHSLIQLCDGATLAHLGYPDMRVPIAYGLHYPERVDVPVRPLDLAELGSLTFEPVDTDTFACLRLAREAGLAGGTAPVHAERRERDRGPRLSGRTPALPPDRRGDRGDAHPAARAAGPLLRFAGATPTRQAAGWPPSWSTPSSPLRRACHTRTRAHVVLPGIPRLRRTHLPARSGPFRGSQGRRNARGALLAVLRADADQAHVGGDRVRDRRHPARGLRADHRDEPQRGARARGRARARTTTSRSGSEWSRSSPGRWSTSSSPSGSCGRCCTPRASRWSCRPSGRSGRQGHAGGELPQARRPDRVHRRRERLARRPAHGDSSHRCAGAQVDGCTAATPATIVLRRQGKLADLPRPAQAGRQPPRSLDSTSGRARRRHHLPQRARRRRHGGLEAVVGHHPDGVDDRPDLRAQGAQAAQQRGRRLHGDPGGVCLERHAGAPGAGADLAVAGRHQPVPVPARWTAGTSSGRWPRRSAGAGSPSA